MRTSARIGVYAGSGITRQVSLMSATLKESEDEGPIRRLPEERKTSAEGGEER